MIKSRLWHEVLNLAICWRFFKYKLILKDTINKLTRDLEYLTKSVERNPEITQDWKLPIELENVFCRAEYLLEELKSLEDPLSEITSMVPSNMTIY